MRFDKIVSHASAEKKTKRLERLGERKKEKEKERLEKFGKKIKIKNKRLERFGISHFYWSFSNDTMAVKGLKQIVKTQTWRRQRS